MTRDKEYLDMTVQAVMRKIRIRIGAGNNPEVEQRLLDMVSQLDDIVADLALIEGHDDD